MIELSEILSNVSKSLPSVQYMLGGLSYLLGIAFVMIALLRFKENSEKSGAGEQSQHPAAPYAYLVTGSMLFFLPSMMNALSATLFGSTNNVLQYGGYVPYDVYGAMTILIETIGIVWFIRGCVLLSHASHPEQGQTGSKGVGSKGLLFVVGGLFAINFHGTVSMMDSAMNYLLNLSPSEPP